MPVCGDTSAPLLAPASAPVAGADEAGAGACGAAGGRGGRAARRPAGAGAGAGGLEATDAGGASWSTRRLSAGPRLGQRWSSRRRGRPAGPARVQCRGHAPGDLATARAALVRAHRRLPGRGLPVPTLAVWKGDRVAACVAAASVVAKVTRDRLMVTMHDRFPMYEFAAHKGYVTPEHQGAASARPVLRAPLLVRERGARWGGAGWGQRRRADRRRPAWREWREARSDSPYPGGPRRGRDARDGGHR